MFYKYFKITKKRVIIFSVLLLSLLCLQYFMVGPLASNQQVTTEAGNSNSSVLGILDDTEVVRQKFVFNRKVTLNAFTISFGSFEKDKVGETLHFQMTDGNNDIVFETDVPVEQIKANADYTVNMDRSVTIPKGVSCCIRLTCSSPGVAYATVPTVNTTNRTDPNTYMSTLKMQTRKKSVNISYSYSYDQVYPLFVFIVEVILLFVISFERITEYSVVFKKKRQKELRKQKKEKEFARKKMAERTAKGKINATENHSNHKKKAKRRKSAYVSDFIKRCLTDKKMIRLIRLIIAVANPLLLFIMLETMNGTFMTILPNVWIFTWILLGALQLVLIGIFHSSAVAMLVMDLFLFPAGLANLFVMNVRGTPFLPADILGVATATEVASTYTFSLTPAQFVVVPAFILWCLLIYKTRVRGKKKPLKTRMIRRAVAVVPGIVIILLLYHTNVLASCGIKDSIWNKVYSCRANGFYMNYFLNLHYLKVSAPSGYSDTKVAEILEEVKSENIQESIGESVNTTIEKPEGEILGNADFGMNKTLNGEKPNIILIMNESLADFDLVSNVNYNKDPLPFLHSMKENTIKGTDYVSVFGAGTSNSEFEAMTGNTMAYFPSGTNVYQQYMHESTFSLPSYLKELGYDCTAVHPSSATNWNRVATYESMKFDEFLSIEDFKNPEYVRYISDKESYKKVIELYENKGDNPLFVFDMTIQNHGGYLTNTNWEETIEIKDSYYTETKEYLSSIHVSDQAFEYLIDYFSKVDEPTMICMFGDHFPSIETDFYEELLGKPQNEWELEDIQKRFASPFVIWANYDIDEAEGVVLGNNYLENLMLKQAGIDLPLYHQYIEKVSREVPAMNVNGYMDADGNWYSYDDDGPEAATELLNDYEILQYGFYSDTDKEKMGEVFQMKP